MMLTEEDKRQTALPEPHMKKRWFGPDGEVTQEVKLLTEIRDLLKIIAANTEPPN
jgi:hypothetical protein